MLQELVHNWLVGGADPEVGFSLYLDYCHPPIGVSGIISTDPKRHLQTIRLSLFKKCGLPLDLIQTSKQTPQSNSSRRKLRNQWPFLSVPTCPPELKLLISDKITIYTDCVKHYQHLTNCATHEELLTTVTKLVTGFIENHEIYQELAYYKKHENVLGAHPIFQQMERLKKLRDLNTMDLFKKKKNLEHTIWRNESKIKKDNRPDLLPERRKKIKDLKMQLAEVDRLLM